jgi:hypothetical protein
MRTVTCPRGTSYLEWTDPIDEPLALVTAVIESASHLVLLDAAAFPEAFFDLRSGFAGEFLQKMVNYRVRVAAVFPPDDGYSERFKEFLSEARRGRDFRAFSDRAEAEAWLCEA